jgi:hypothetical protein
LSVGLPVVSGNVAHFGWIGENPHLSRLRRFVSFMMKHLSPETPGRSSKVPGMGSPPIVYTFIPTGPSNEDVSPLDGEPLDVLAQGSDD